MTKDEALEKYGAVKLLFKEYDDNTATFEATVNSATIGKHVYGGDTSRRRFFVGQTTTIREPEPDDAFCYVWIDGKKIIDFEL